MRLSERQWELMEHLFPEPKRRRDGRGQPWASNRQCVEGILWVLRTGARWRDLPAEYPSGVTCWRRLRRWEDEGVWLEVGVNVAGSQTDNARLRLTFAKRTRMMMSFAQADWCGKPRKSSIKNLSNLHQLCCCSLSAGE